MKVWSAIYNLVAVVVIVMLSICYLNVSRVMERDFEQARYDYAVEQATEALFSSTLHADDIDLDYKDMKYISIDSSEAIKIFDRVMCFNYDMSPSEENFNAINQSIACCVLAGYDGYYLAETSDSDTLANGKTVDGYSLRFSAKIPYYVYTDTTTYAIDTYKKTYLSMSNNNNADNPYLYTRGETLPAGVTEDDVKSAINTQIRSTILNEVADSKNISMKAMDQFRLYFPEDRTATGVNPLEVPGIFVIMAGAKYASTDTLSSMSVSGYKVIKKVNVIAFTDLLTNRSYYCYESQLKDEEKDATSGGLAIGGTYGSFHIDNYYDSIQAASEAVNPNTGEHYAPYYDIMARKITKA